ncbi:MAG: PAS domain S-box protein [Alphaproteobacteria bacterium]|nr:PAS domain S-box protein [Alphaproteobacteria bacterium]
MQSLRHFNTIAGMVRSVVLYGAPALFLLAGGLALRHGFSGWLWEYPPLHAIVESLGAFTAITLATVIVTLRSYDRLSPKYDHVAVALVAMGALELFHAAVPPGPTSQFLGDSNRLVGGVLLAATGLPRIGKTRRSALILAIAMTLLIAGGLFVILMSGHKLAHVGAVGRVMNLVACLGYLVAAGYFMGMWRRAADHGDLALYYFCSIMAVSCFRFLFALWWGPTWWFWHIATMLAYLVVLAYFVTLFRQSENRLRQLHIQLEQRFEERTLQLRAEIEERKRSEQARLDSEMRLRDMAEAMSDWLWECGPDLWFTYVSEGRETFGKIIADVLAKTNLNEILRQATSAKDRERFFADLTGHRPFRDVPFLIHLADGAEIHVAIGGKPVFDGSGGFLGYRGIMSDITEAKLAKDKIESLAVFPQLNPNPVFRITMDGTLVYANRAGQPLLDFWACRVGGIVPEDIRRLVYRVHNLGGTHDIEYSIADKIFWLNVSAIAPENSVHIYASDITERKRQAEALERAKFLLRDAIESIQGGLALWDVNDRLVLCNNQYCEPYGDRSDTIIGTCFEDALRIRMSQNHYQVDGDPEAWIAARIDSHHRAEGSFEQHLTDGRVMLINERRTRDGGIVSIRTDITSIKKAEAALRRSEKLMRIILDNSPAVIFLKDREGKYLLINRKYETLFHVSMDEIVGKTDYDLFPKELADHFRADDRSVLDDNRSLQTDEIVPMDNGSHITFMTIKFPFHDETGQPQAVAGIATDITERKKTEAELLRASRMEAIGQLASGVAHDFNNLLTVIKGNLELLDDFTNNENESEINDILGDAMLAVGQGVHLTRGLLAFARQEPLPSQPIDVNSQILRMSTLVQRALRESIYLSLDLQVNLPHAQCDDAHFGTSILNLALNARDAMVTGGTLTIRTREITIPPEQGVTEEGVTDLAPGHYVAIAVEDTGCGIAPEIRDRVFDPLFTTKRKGTGLGLRMVSQFTSRSGGATRLSSEVDHGTTVTLLLPVATQAAAPSEIAIALQTGHREIVLLVEDDMRVRKFARRCLEGLGYSVIEAEGADAALDILRGRDTVAILFSDIMMPGGRTGIDLARQVKSQWPHLGILLCTGSSSMILAAREILGAEITVLLKPYSKGDLAREIRKILDTA